MKRFGLVLAVAPWVATLGCEFVIGDETRVVADGGDATRLGDVAIGPDVSGSQPDASPSSQPDACGAQPACMAIAMMCPDSCVPPNVDCMGNVLAKDCAKKLAPCEVPCLPP